jgi:DNA primase
MIHRFSENITVLYDGDAAGIKAALRGIDLLLEDGMNVKVVLLPEGEDPDSLQESRMQRVFINILRRMRSILSVLKHNCC